MVLMVVGNETVYICGPEDGGVLCILTYLLTYLLSPCSRFLLEKVTGIQLGKNLPTYEYYGTWKLLTSFTSTPPTCLYPDPDQSIPWPYPTSWRFILILSFHLCLGLPSGLIPSVSHQNPVCTSPLPIRATCSTHLILRPNNILWVQINKLLTL